MTANHFNTEYRDVSVRLLNVITLSHRVSFKYGELNLYEDFPDEEQAQFWATAIRDGNWSPLDQTPSRELRNEIENDQL